MKQIDNIATVEPLLVEILSIQNPSANEITKWQAIDKVKSLVPKKFFIEEDHYGNLLFDNRPSKKRTEPVPTIIAHLDQVHDYARGFRLALLGDELVAYDHVGRRVGTGGDDKCGIYVLIKLLLSDIPCRAIVTQDEEIGLLGAEQIVPRWGEQSSILLQADRRGCNDLINHTNGNLIADKQLVDNVLALPECAGMRAEYGSVTDVGDLCSLFEVAGFNISAGYYDAHSARESIKLSELQLCLSRVMAICRMVGSTVQPYPEQEYRSYRFGSSGGGGLGGRYDWDDLDEDIVCQGMYYLTRGGIVIGPMQRVTSKQFVVAKADSDEIKAFVESNYGCDYTLAVWNEFGECNSYPDLDIQVDVDGSLVMPDDEDDVDYEDDDVQMVLDNEIPLPEWAPTLPNPEKGHRWVCFSKAARVNHPYMFTVGNHWMGSDSGSVSVGDALLYVKSIPVTEVKAPLTLEIGKRYVTRGGQVTEPLSEFVSTAPTALAFASTLANDASVEVTWYPDGHYFADGVESPFDIVSEYEEPFPLEVGHFYEARNGETVGPLEATNVAMYPFKCGKRTWDRFGRTISDGQQRSTDLVKIL